MKPSSRGDRWSPVGDIHFAALIEVLRSRRPGDAPRLVADNRAAREVLGGNPRRDITDMARDVWGWHGRWPQA